MTSRVRPDPPAGLSEQARRFWANLPAYAEPVFPELGDGDGWRVFIETMNGHISTGYDESGLDLAMSVDLIDGVETHVLRPNQLADPGSSPIYLEIHGGALFLGGGDLARLTATDIATVNGMVTWAPDYRLLPDHPYPAALDDCMAVYRALLDVRDPRDIFVGGASAGGNLSAALVARARDEGLAVPAALVLMSPQLDLTESGDTFQTLLGIDIMSSVRTVSLMYAAGHDLAHPYLSPLFADVAGFPPTFLQAGTRDLFLSNAARMHAKLRDAGVEAELHVSEGMPHGGFSGAPEDDHLRRQVRRFLDRHRHDESDPVRPRRGRPAWAWPPYPR